MKNSKRIKRMKEDVNRKKNRRSKRKKLKRKISGEDMSDQIISYVISRSDLMKKCNLLMLRPTLLDTFFQIAVKDFNDTKFLTNKRT